MAAAPEASTEEAILALQELRGVDLSIASAILAAIYPERYIELDFHDLEALGQARQDVRFYEEYLVFCQAPGRSEHREARRTICPEPTPLRALDRALSQWSRNRLDVGGCKESWKWRWFANLPGGDRIARS